MFYNYYYNELILNLVFGVFHHNFICLSMGGIPGSALDSLGALLKDFPKFTNSGFPVEVRVLWGAMMLVFFHGC